MGKSPRKQKNLVPILKIDNDTQEDSSGYENVSYNIDPISPGERRVGFGAFKNVDFWMSKAHEATELNQIDAAIDFYRHGLGVDGNNPTIYYNIGALFSLKNQCKKAMNCFDKVSEIIQKYGFMCDQYFGKILMLNFE